MPVWRCPHCGTPQAESSRCWVCRRSTTACATCRHFRRGIASGLGLCGLDPRRSALRGTEIRACWIAPDAAVEQAPPVPRPDPSPDPARRPARTFVPVDELVAAAAPAPAPLPRPTPVGSTPVPAGPGSPVAAPSAHAAGWSLWSDLEA